MQLNSLIPNSHTGTETLGRSQDLTPTAFAERYASSKEVDYATQLAYP